MYNITNLNDANNLNTQGFSIFMNAEVCSDKVEYNQLAVEIKIKWEANFDMSAFNYTIKEYVSHDYKKTWVTTGSSDGTIYENNIELAKQKNIYKSQIIRNGLRQHFRPTNYRYVITFFLDDKKTIALSTASNDITLPTLYDYFYSNHCFIKQKHIENNIWELTFMNVSSEKSEYRLLPVDIKWYLFDEEKSYWVELKEFENKEKIKLNIDLKRKKFKVYTRWLRKDRPHDSWSSMYSDEIVLITKPWFMPNIKNLKIYFYPRILSLDSLNLQKIQKLIKENLDSIINNAKDIPLNLIELIKYVFFGKNWNHNVLVINDVECKINQIMKNDEFTEFEIKVVSKNGYIFKNYSFESYSLIIRI